MAVAAQADDASGTVAIGVGLSAAPASWVVGLIGTRSGDSCGAPYVLLRGRPSSGVAEYARDTASGFSPARMTVDGNVVIRSRRRLCPGALPGPVPGSRVGFLG